ncbi:MAG: Cys-tRNA(Pro) deacylase [Clostridiales bacterium]|nr:Cys-tRNA(Pro) deacylase [Clostridiales bacterium]
MAKNDKTNAMRKLDSMKISYKEHYYTDSGAVSGAEVAAALNEDPDKLFKTLVATGKSGSHYVFMVPVSSELDLKKAAAAVGEKSVEMLKSKDLLPLTGYVHGGCSPIGMKKFFTTVVNISAKECGTIFCSGGKIGFQIEITPEDLAKVIKFEYADIVKA